MNSMLALVLLAQIAASPSPAPPSTPVAALGTASGAVSAKPRTLADVARETRLGKKGAKGGTLSVAGAPGPSGGTDAGESAPARGTLSPAKARVRAAEAEVQAARRALDDAAVRTGMTSENAAAMRARLAQARRALADAQGSAAAR